MEVAAQQLHVGTVRWPHRPSSSSTSRRARAGLLRYRFVGLPGARNVRAAVGPTTVLRTAVERTTRGQFRLCRSRCPPAPTAEHLEQVRDALDSTWWPCRGRTAWTRYFRSGLRLAPHSHHIGPDLVAAGLTGINAQSTERAHEHYPAPVLLLALPLRLAGVLAASGETGPERRRGGGSARSVAVAGATAGRARQHPAQARRSADPVPTQPVPCLARNRRPGTQHPA